MLSAASIDFILIVFLYVLRSCCLLTIGFGLIARFGGPLAGWAEGQSRIQIFQAGEIICKGYIYIYMYTHTYEYINK